VSAFSLGAVETIYLCVLMSINKQTKYEVNVKFKLLVNLLLVCMSSRPQGKLFYTKMSSMYESSSSSSWRLKTTSGQNLH